MQEDERGGRLRRLVARGRGLALQWLPPLVVFAFVRSAVASPFHVPTGSMVPSIEVGDRILVSKLAYGLNVPWLEVGAGWNAGAFSTRELVRWGEPARGDVVLFRPPPDPSIDFVKRVVGIPGDRVEVIDGVVQVNGEAQVRSWVGGTDFVDQDCRSWPARQYEEDLGGVRHPVLDSVWREGSDFGPVTVPAGRLFVMGDNRDHSTDSRVWGMVPRDQVRGQVMGVWMSSSCEGGTEMRWRPL